MSNVRKEGIDPTWFEKAEADTFGPVAEGFNRATDSSHNLAGALGDFLEQAYRRRGRRFRHLTVREQLIEAGLLLRRSADIVEAHILAQSAESATGRLDVQTFKYSPHKIKLALINGSASSQTIEFNERQKQMLAYLGGITKMKVKNYIYPWITRAELAQMAEDLSVVQFNRGLLTPLNEVGAVEVNKRFGYRLNCEPEDVLEVVVARGDQQSLRLKAPEEWYEVRIKPALFYTFQFPVLTSLYRQVIQDTPPETALDLEGIRLDTGLSRDALYEQLKKLRDQGILQSVGRGSSYRVENLNRTLLEAVIKAQKPFKIKVQRVELEEAGLLTAGTRKDSLLSSSTVQGEVKPKEFTPNPNFLQILERPFRKELSGATGKGFPPEGYLRPTAVFPYHRSLSKKAKRIPWRELQQLGLALESGRDHHPEMLLVGGLIAALYLNERVYSEVSSHSNGSSALEFMTLHVAYLLREEEKRLAIGDPRSVRLKYVRTCLKSLREALENYSPFF